MLENNLIPKGGARLSALAAWAFYDWANSAFPTVITTFVFAAYFEKAIAADPVSGTEAWGYALSASALAVAFAGPVLGAIADHAGRRKPWVFAFTACCVVATGMLWFAEPDPSHVIWTLIVVALANFSFEMGMVFYNSMLPDLAGRHHMGRVSGLGWGLGYVGGLACLVLTLIALVQTETPWFGLSKANSENIRAIGPLVAVWFAVFSLPFFLFTPDVPASGISFMDSVRRGLNTLRGTFAQIHQYASIARFLLARMIYTDGLTTLFTFGGIYAAGTFGMDFEELILFGIGMNVTAGFGAAAFAWVDDWIGPKRTILIALGCLTVLGAAVLMVPTKTLFWVFGLPLGLFVGPAQAASRSMMAHMAPDGLHTEMFGLYALSGKATAFLGPALLGLITGIFESQRAGMAVILVFLIAGILLLRGVPDVRS
ncbi:MAG: MFS transporter [Rhodospirillales bacterium]|nr:MFS transporter [Rhodospirillales bacterium]